MKLTVLDRLLALGVLPQKGKIGDIRVIHDLKMKIALSADEQDKIGLREDAGNYRWDGKADAEFDFAPREIVLLADALKALSEAGELTEQQIPLWEKFVEPEEKGSD